MEGRSRMGEFVEVSRGLTSLLRDAGLILVVVIMIASPDKFKSFLSEAGINKAFGLEFDLDSFDKLETAQVLISNLQNENDQLVKALKEAETKIGDDGLKTKIDAISRRSTEQKKQTALVQRDVSKILEKNTPIVEKELSQLKTTVFNNNALYTVGLQTYGVANAKRESLNQSLEDKGYSLDDITYSYPSSSPLPSWFARQPTVFYYAASAKASAENLAELLSSLTGQTFVVQRGAGLGVDPDRKDTTLFAHYLNR